MGDISQAPEDESKDASSKPPVVLNLSVVLPYMQYRKKLRFFNGMYTPNNKYRLLLMLLLIFVLWTFQSGFIKRSPKSYDFGVVLSLSYSFPQGWTPGSANAVAINIITYLLMILIVIMVAVHVNRYDPFMQALGIVCVALFAVVLGRRTSVESMQDLDASTTSGGFFLTQDLVMQIFVWLALLHMAVLAAVRIIMPMAVRRNWLLVRCKITERRELTDPAAVAPLIDLPPGYSLTSDRRLVACYLRYITPWYAPLLGHYESITYVGEVNSGGHPTGYGEWRDTHWHGEHLTGFWHAGHPTGPFRSRETGSASGFINLRIAYFRNRDEAMRKAACLPRLKPLQFGIVGCEVSTSGAWFKSLPRLHELLPPVNIAEGLIAEEEAAIDEGRIPPAASQRYVRSLILTSQKHELTAPSRALGPSRLVAPHRAIDCGAESSGESSIDGGDVSNPGPLHPSMKGVTGKRALRNSPAAASYSSAIMPLELHGVLAGQRPRAQQEEIKPGVRFWDGDGGGATAATTNSSGTEQLREGNLGRPAEVSVTVASAHVAVDANAANVSVGGGGKEGSTSRTISASGGGTVPDSASSNRRSRLLLTWSMAPRPGTSGPAIPATAPPPAAAVTASTPELVPSLASPHDPVAQPQLSNSPSSGSPGTNAAAAANPGDAAAAAAGTAAFNISGSTCRHVRVSTAPLPTSLSLNLQPRTNQPLQRAFTLGRLMSVLTRRVAGSSSSNNGGGGGSGGGGVGANPDRAAMPASHAGGNVPRTGLEGLMQAERVLQAPSLRHPGGGRGTSSHAPSSIALAAPHSTLAGPPPTGVFFHGMGHVPRLVSMLMPLQPAPTTTVHQTRQMTHGSGVQQVETWQGPDRGSGCSTGGIGPEAGPQGRLRHWKFRWGFEDNVLSDHQSDGTAPAHIAASAAWPSPVSGSSLRLTRKVWRLRSAFRKGLIIKFLTPAKSPSASVLKRIAGVPRSAGHGGHGGHGGLPLPSRAGALAAVEETGDGPVQHRALVSFIRSSQPFAVRGNSGAGSANDGSLRSHAVAGVRSSRSGRGLLQCIDEARTPAGASSLSSGSLSARLGSRSVRSCQIQSHDSDSYSQLQRAATRPEAGAKVTLLGEMENTQRRTAWPTPQPPLKFNFDRPPEALLFVHGLGVDMHKALRHYAQMMALIGFPPYITPVLFSWPSSVPLAYFWARYRGAEPPETGLALAAAVRALAADGFAGLHILVHSMGTRVLNNALPHLEAILGEAAVAAAAVPTTGDVETSSDDTSPGKGAGGSGVSGGGGGGGYSMKLRTVTICNPDFGLKRFLTDMGPRLRALCPHVTLYGDTADGALALSEVVNAVARPFVDAGAAIADVSQAVPSLAVSTAAAVQGRAKSAAAMVIEGTVNVVERAWSPDTNEEFSAHSPGSSLPGLLSQQRQPPPGGDPEAPPLALNAAENATGQRRCTTQSHFCTDSTAPSSIRTQQQQHQQNQPPPQQLQRLTPVSASEGNISAAAGDTRREERNLEGVSEVAGQTVNSGLRCDSQSTAPTEPAAAAAAVVAVTEMPQIAPSGETTAVLTAAPHLHAQGIQQPPIPPPAPPPPAPPSPPPPPTTLHALSQQQSRRRHNSMRQPLMAEEAQLQPQPQPDQPVILETAGVDGDAGPDPTGGSLVSTAATIAPGAAEASVNAATGQRPHGGPSVATPSNIGRHEVEQPGVQAVTGSERGTGTSTGTGCEVSNTDNRDLTWWSERVVNYRRRLNTPMLYRWLEHSLGRRIYQVQDPTTGTPLDIDVVDMSYLSSNVNSVRHTHFALNREILDDLWELIVLDRRASQRKSRLEHVTGNVYSIAVAPSYLSTKEI